MEYQTSVLGSNSLLSNICSCMDIVLVLELSRSVHILVHTRDQVTCLPPKLPFIEFHMLCPVIMADIWS